MRRGESRVEGEQGRGRKSSNCRGLLIADMIGAIASHGHKQRRKRDFHFYDQVRCLSLLFGTLCPFPVPLAKRGEIGQLQLQHSTALLLIHHKYTHTLTHTLHTHTVLASKIALECIKAKLRRRRRQMKFDTFVHCTGAAAPLPLPTSLPPPAACSSCCPDAR